MDNPIDRDRFDEDLFPREEATRDINYFPIDDNTAFVGGLIESYRIIRTELKDLAEDLGSLASWLYQSFRSSRNQ